MHYRGHVEMKTEEMVLHADELFYDQTTFKMRKRRPIASCSAD